MIQISKKAIRIIRDYVRRKERLRNQIALMTEIAFRDGAISSDAHDRIADKLSPQDEETDSHTDI